MPQPSLKIQRQRLGRPRRNSVWAPLRIRLWLPFSVRLFLPLYRKAPPGKGASAEGLHSSDKVVQRRAIERVRADVGEAEPARPVDEEVTSALQGIALDVDALPAAQA